MKKILLSSVVALYSLSLTYANDKVLNINNPDPYKGFKMDYAQMVEIANPERLSFRIFYEAPSQGRHKEWFDAIKRGDLEKVKAMVTNGQDIEAIDQEALGWATFIGYEEIVEYLINIGADVNIVATTDAWWNGKHPAYDQNALTFACKSASKEMVALLIKNGAVNHKTGKPLCD